MRTAKDINNKCLFGGVVGLRAITIRTDMENIYKHFLDSLIEAEKLWRNADYLVYVTFPVVKDKKILLKALEDAYKSAVLSISIALKFEYLYKRVGLSSDPRKNLETFFRSCAKKYGMSEGNCSTLNELLILGKRHRESGFEFTRKGKVVILDGNLASYELKVEKLKEFLSVEKALIAAIKNSFES